MTREERIEALTTLKEQARYYGDNTFVWSINIDSFNFVIDSTIKALEQEPFINKSCVSSGVCEHDKQKVLEKIDEIITDALDKSTDQKESQTLRWVLDKISEVT